jgi:hypothetical protein
MDGVLLLTVEPMDGSLQIALGAAPLDAVTARAA